MRALLNLIRWMLLGLFRSKTSLEAEILALHHQLNVLRRASPRRPVFSNFDRMIFVCLYRIAPRILDALTIVEPETVIRWYRAGFRSFWRWKSRRRAGRPSVPPEIRRLIRKISLANPLWGAPRIHGELLKLGIDVGQTSVAKYMARRRRPPSQGWRTFLLNHANGIASIDLCVPKTGFGRIGDEVRQEWDVIAAFERADARARLCPETSECEFRYSSSRRRAAPGADAPRQRQ